MDHSKTGQILLTIQNPDMFGFQIPTVIGLNSIISSGNIFILFSFNIKTNLQFKLELMTRSD